MRDIAEILQHWHAGRPLKAVARSLGVDRKTVRKYAALAQEAGFAAGSGQGPPDGWATWLDDAYPGLREQSRQQPTSALLDPWKEEMLQALREVPPTTTWRRPHRAAGCGCPSPASAATCSATCLRRTGPLGSPCADLTRRPETRGRWTTSTWDCGRIPGPDGGAWYTPGPWSSPAAATCSPAPS